MTPNDHFKALGLPPAASEEDIKRAYRHLAKLCHPDRDKTPGADERFRDLTKSYTACLAFQKATPPRQKAQSAWVGTDVAASLKVTLQDLVSCARKPVSARRTGTCRGCDGTGSKARKTLPCRYCGGSGLSGMELVLGQKKRCKYCGGVGRIPEEPKCAVCGGTGLAVEAFRVEIDLNPYSVAFVLQGEGNRCAGGSPGNLTVALEMARDGDVTLSGLDLKTSVRVTPAESVVGTEVSKTILGVDRVITVPAGTPDGAWLAFQGQGVCYRGKVGNLKVRVQVQVPGIITREEEELYKKIIQLEKDSKPKSFGF